MRGGVCEVVRAETADLERFVERGRLAVGSLRAIFDEVAAARSRVVAVMGAAEVPPPMVARPLGGPDPLAELIAEATLANAFVEGVSQALGTTMTGGVGGLVPAEVVDAALALAGLDPLGADRSKATDQELVEDLAIRRELAAIVAAGADGPGHLQGQMIGVALEDHLDGLGPAEAERTAAVLVDYGIDLQADLDPDEDGTGRATAATLLVTQGLLLWPADRSELVDDLAGRSVPSTDDGRVLALTLAVDALDLDESNEELSIPGLWWGPWQRANQPFVRQAVLAELIEATQRSDGRISASGQCLVDDVLDRYPQVVDRAEGLWHEIDPDDRYHTAPEGNEARKWPSRSLHSTLARALAAPNDGLDADADAALALALDALDQRPAEGTLGPAVLDRAWLEREILVEVLAGGPEASALLLAAMGAGLSAPEALRLVRFGADPDRTDARVRRLRVVYDTTPWGDPVPVDDLDPDVWTIDVARSLAVELSALQGVQLATFAEGRPEPQLPLSAEQVDLVVRYDEVARWFHHRFAWGWPGGAEAAVDHLRDLDDDELGRILFDVPDGFAELIDELARPENQIVWDLLAGAADNDTFLGPEGTFRPASGPTVTGADPQALLVQLALLREVGPYHELLDGGRHGDGTITEGEVERWLEAARDDPSIPPAVVDRVALGARFGLGHDTFGWDEIAAITGVTGLAAAAVVTIVFSGGTAVPLWVQGGLAGLAALEGVAAWKAGDGVGAVLAGAGGVGDLLAAARLRRLADERPPAGAVDDAGRAIDEHPDLVELARRSDIDELSDLAGEAADLTPARFVDRYRAILDRHHSRIVDDLLDQGLEPAQVAVVLREADIEPVLAPGRIGHALDGNVNGLGHASGGHHANSPNVRVLTRSEPDANGVTTGTIQVRDPATGRWVAKPANRLHTFFPDHWTRRRTELEIDHAFRNSWPDPVDRDRWRGVASDGTPIWGFSTDELEPWRGWSAAYPVYGKMRRIDEHS